MTISNDAFLDFVISFDFFQDEESALDKVNEFLQAQSKKKTSFFAISFSREHSIFEDGLKYYRKIYLPKLRNQTHNFDELAKACFVKKTTQPESPDFFQQKVGQLYVTCFRYFEKTNQQHWIIFLDQEKTQMDFLKKLFQFMKKIADIKSYVQDLETNKNLAYVDDVTSLFNQRKLYKDLNHLVERHRENEDSFSVLFIDIDYFKKVNDGHGHLIGSKLLAELADVIRSSSRDSDHIYRYGGDEFVMILPKCDKEIASKVAERLLSKVKAHNFQVINQKEMSHLHLSVSIGIASYPEDATGVEDVLRIADETMYEAKKTGRGKVYFYSKS